MGINVYFLWCSYFVLGAFSCLVFYLTLGDMLSHPAEWIIRKFKHKETDLNRRTFLAMVGVSATNVALGVAEVARGPRVYEVRVPIADLPDSFDGHRIVQISDLHVGPTIDRHYVERVRDMTNELDADMVALTGDLLDGYPETIRDDLQPLADIRSREGLFFVSGNHEYYWGYPAWEKVFQEWGFRILENSSYILTRGKDRMAVVGIPDVRGKRFTGVGVDLDKAMEGVLPSDKKILLAHRPHVFDKENRYHIDLQLSGHTHGGQYFPWKLFISMVWPYYAGLYDHKGTWIYVNRGTGHWGPPLRFTVTAEITHMTLVKAS